MMILSLMESFDEQKENSGDLVSLVGGKAASLIKLYSTPGLSSHVPHGFALTVEFFRGWVDQVVKSQEYKTAQEKLAATTKEGNSNAVELTQLCNDIKSYSKTLELSSAQHEAIEKLKQHVGKWKMTAIRSSAPEEDGAGASFAGAFETKLGVTSTNLVQAVRDCFASLFDYRVFSYVGSSILTDGDKKNPSFAAVVMEMIDSNMAGVAFSVNPINSDLDELVVDCSWGLGESVVDGSVEADRFMWDKVNKKAVEKSIGSKKQEKRLGLAGGVQVMQVDEARQLRSTLSDKQLEDLADLVCLIEETYKMPMDVEFAFMGGSDSADSSSPQLKLLQARPITTNYTLDEAMITEPGEPRVLYYDFNIAHDATTTEPFTHLDLKMYCKMSSILMGAPDLDLFSDDPKMLMFNASTRQYMNVSIMFRWFAPEKIADRTRLMDPYLANTFSSRDCDHKKYKAKKCPKWVNLRNAFWLMRQFPLLTMYKRSRKYKSHPQQAKEEYLEISRKGRVKLKEVHGHGVKRDEGLLEYIKAMIATAMPALDEDMSVIFFVLLPTFHELDKKRRDGKTEELRQEYDSLCGGYEGDPIMEINIAMHKLARSLPASIWSEYDHSNFDKLAERIQSNIDGSRNDIPAEFLAAWKSFMDTFGYYGQEQMFVSSPRYIDNPAILLAMISHNVGDGIKDPAVIQQTNVARRREAMARREERARKRCCNRFALSSVKKQNAILENLMWIRNAPKMNLTQIMGMIRAALLEAEAELIQSKRLEQAGDIFHLDIEEIDTAMMKDPSLDLMKLVIPRKAMYEKAKRATQCPILVDSRNRILRPDVVQAEPGTLVGAAISPGVATGKVRMVHDPTDVFESGEVLVAVVTDPAWTPLMVGAAAVILQIGSVLQHGALCAREYGKPAVSGIDVRANLKTGMMVSVDGNTGIVKFLDEEGKE